MAAGPFDSALYRDLFHDAEVGQLFTDSAELRAMLIVEGALANVQGKLGMIPETSAAFIHRASMEVQVDPAGLSSETGQSAVCVPALVAAFRKAMEAPEHAQYVHWGATSQDIIDTGLVLRLRKVLEIFEARIGALLVALADLAEAHADLPMAARTWGQVATPTSFGAVVAGWGQPLLRHRQRLRDLRPRLMAVSLAGASGTLSAMGARGAEVRAGLAQALGLEDPQASWHSARDNMAELAGWMTNLATSLGKMGEDLRLLMQSEVGEVRGGPGGGSSTMPQKQNPVLPNLMVALARQIVGLNANIQASAVHAQQRDGAAWMVEWMSLPQMVMALARALAAAQSLSEGIAPDAARMAAGLDDGLGLIYGEALTFALAPSVPRPEAQQAVKELCQKALRDGVPLPDLARQRWPEADLEGIFDPALQMGDAPEQARRFAEAARMPSG